MHADVVVDVAGAPEWVMVLDDNFLREMYLNITSSTFLFNYKH
jgi:hypothetical protein